MDQELCLTEFLESLYEVGSVPILQIRKLRLQMVTWWIGGPAFKEAPETCCGDFSKRVGVRDCQPGWEACSGQDPPPWDPVLVGYPVLFPFSVETSLLLFGLLRCSWLFARWHPSPTVLPEARSLWGDHCPSVSSAPLHTSLQQPRATWKTAPSHLAHSLQSALRLKSEFPVPCSVTL